MNFTTVDSRYAELKEQYAAGTLTAEAFDTALRDMMVQDAQGHWWAKSREAGEWNYYDNNTNAWVVAQPPSVPVMTPMPTPPYVGPMSVPQLPGTASTIPGAETAAVPKISPVMTIVWYIASFLFVPPLVGVVIFFMYRNKPNPSDRKVAKVSLILGVVAFLLFYICMTFSQVNTGY